MTTTEKRTGRPAKKQSDQTFKDNGLYALLVEKLGSPYVRVTAEAQQSILDTLRMAKDMGVSRYTVYRILNEQKLTKRTFQGLAKIAKGRIESVDLLPYLMND
ncbi:helix-turn-helix DNA binding domain protein [Rhodobacter phage RcCWillis]|nr:helix-turn-helix DNA binding domain protein [Rhodobacter phage RcCWillis]